MSYYIFVKREPLKLTKSTHAQVLLKLDESFNEKPWNVEGHLRMPITFLSMLSVTLPPVSL